MLSFIRLLADLLATFFRWIGMIVVCMILVINRYTILEFVGKMLVIDEKPTAVDMIFVLNGDIDTRPFKAAELYQAKVAPRIGIAKAEDSPTVALGLVQNTTDLAQQVLESQNVPKRAIDLMLDHGVATSTYDEAMILKGFVKDHPQIKEVVIVTSSFHTRRAKWIFERVLAPVGVKVSVSAAPHRHFDQTNWWRSESGVIMCWNEYIKLLYYYWNYW